MYAVVAQMLYVGAQVGIWGLTINFVTELLPGISKAEASTHYAFIGTILFVSGRALGTVFMLWIKDHRLLTLYAFIAATLSLCGVLADGPMAIYAILLLNFFMSIMFPTIFALGVKELGDQTKLGSSFIIMSIVGGAFIPPLMGLIVDTTLNIQLAFLIPFVCFLFVIFFGWKGYKPEPLIQ